MSAFTERENLKKFLIFFFFLTKDLPHDEDIDPGLNLFNKKKLQKLNSVYHTPEKSLKFDRSPLEDSFSIFQLNIRSVNKSFEKFKDLLN